MAPCLSSWTPGLPGTPAHAHLPPAAVGPGHRAQSMPGMLSATAMLCHAQLCLPVLTFHRSCTSILPAAVRVLHHASSFPSGAAWGDKGDERGECTATRGGQDPWCPPHTFLMGSVVPAHAPLTPVASCQVPPAPHLEVVQRPEEEFAVLHSACMACDACELGATRAGSVLGGRAPKGTLPSPLSHRVCPAVIFPPQGTKSGGCPCCAQCLAP